MANHQKCKNCNQTFIGSFCNNCGQKNAANKRLQLKEIIFNFIDDTFSVDKGFFFTFYKLITKPGKVVTDFINGKRKYYTNPTRFLIIALAVQTLSAYLFGSNDALINEDTVGFSFLSNIINENMWLWNVRLLIDYKLLGNVIEVILFPLGFHLLFRNVKYHYSELLVMGFYYLSIIIFFIQLILLMSKLFFDVYPHSSIVTLIVMIYLLWACTSFFKETKLWLRIPKVILAILIFLFIRYFVINLLLAYFFPLT